MMKISASNQACGAEVTGLDLLQPLSDEDIAAIRNAWLEHHVLSFPDQQLDDDALERFSLSFGAFGDDPFIAPIEGRNHIVAVKRDADETSPIFAEAWHTDWSFQKVPPAGTCLYSITVPPVGGDTLFANQHLALQEMPAELRSRIDGVNAIHSAKLAYAPDGAYGEADADRSMDIITNDAANKTQTHPLIRTHRESGKPGLYGCAGYIIGLEGVDQNQAQTLLLELYEWQTQEQFQYRHQWQEGTVLMWDNRSVLHAATGGFDGHARLLHRTTIADTL